MKAHPKTSQKKLKRPRAPRALQAPNAFAFTLAGFQSLGGPGKSSVYELAKACKLILFKDPIGRTLIDGNSARAYLGIPA